MMKMFESLADYIDKARSRIYGVFMFWVFVFGSPVVFTILFVDQNIISDKRGLLKGEYIVRTFFDFTQWWPGLYAPAIFICSALMTYLMIAVLPKTLIKWSYEKELEDQSDREFMKIQKEDELNKRRQSIVDQQEKIVEKEESVAKRQTKLETKERSAWQEDYDEFKQSTMYGLFSELQKSLYKHGGRVYASDVYDNVEFELPDELTAYLDANELITLSEGVVTLTPKGKYYMKRYLNESTKEFDINSIAF